MKRAISWIGIVFGGLWCLCLASGCAWLTPRGDVEISLGDFDAAVEVIGQRISETMKSRDVPGGVVSLVDGQSVLWERAYGWADLEADEPVAMDTIFRVGSISKVFTAIATMKMVEEGLVDLDGAITDYIKDFTIQRLFDDETPITIRSLLTHRSGLPRNGALPLWYWDTGASTLRELVASLETEHAAYPPWTRYKYSNIGYVILGHLLDVVRRVEWPFYMQREILRPIGMDSSAFLAERVPNGARIAKGYFEVKGKQVADGAGDIITMPSGNLYSTAPDLAEFIQFIFRDGEANGMQLIQADSLREMSEARYARSDDPQANGLGWFTDTSVFGEQILFHSGTNGGTKSIVALLPESELGVVLIGNGAGFEELLHELAFFALDVLRQAKTGLRRPVSGESEEAMEDAEIRTAYEGTYVVEGEVFHIRRRGEGLSAAYRGIPAGLKPLGDERFRLQSWLLSWMGFDDVVFHLAEAPARVGVTLAGNVHISCPRVTVWDELPEAWLPILGEYDVRPRVESRYSDAETLGTVEIMLKDGLLRMMPSGLVLLRASDSRIEILGGIFDGESIVRDPDTGVLKWGSRRYVPLRGA